MNRRDFLYAVAALAALPPIERLAPPTAMPTVVDWEKVELFRTPLPLALAEITGVPPELLGFTGGVPAPPHYRHRPSRRVS